jgi:hypothetical protein
MAPEEIVQAQVEAYNDRDIDQFVACHDPYVKLFAFAETEPYAVGRQELREIYQDVFENSPDLHAKITNRMVFGNKVIDHEIVTGRKGIDRLEIIAIYEVEEGLIAKAYFIRG